MQPNRPTQQVHPCPLCGGEGTVHVTDSLVDSMCPLCDGEKEIWSDEPETERFIPNKGDEEDYITDYFYDETLDL